MLLMNPFSLFYLTIGVFMLLAFGAVPGLGGQLNGQNFKSTVYPN